MSYFALWLLLWLCYQACTFSVCHLVRGIYIITRTWTNERPGRLISILSSFTMLSPKHISSSFFSVVCCERFEILIYRSHYARHDGSFSQRLLVVRSSVQAAESSCFSLSHWKRTEELCTLHDWALKCVVVVVRVTSRRRLPKWIHVFCIANCSPCS